MFRPQDVARRAHGKKHQETNPDKNKQQLNVSRCIKQHHLNMTQHLLQERKYSTPSKNCPESTPLKGPNLKRFKKPRDLPSVFQVKAVSSPRRPLSVSCPDDPRRPPLMPAVHGRSSGREYMVGVRMGLKRSNP